MDARSKLIDLAAFLDRVQKAGQESDLECRQKSRASILWQNRILIQKAQ